MTGPLISKRLVFHFGGYHPDMPPEISHRRFARELSRFEKTWSAKASVSPAIIDADKAIWDVTTTGPNWRVDSRHCLARWDDLVETFARQPQWRRIPLGQLAFLDFAMTGTLWRYFRANWRYALFFLYPFLIFDAFVVAAWFAGGFFARATDALPIGIAAGLLIFVALMRGPGRWFKLGTLFDDWIFSRAYIREKDSILERRLDTFASQIVAAVRRSDCDEIVVIGHSLGAVLAVDVLDRALKLGAAPGKGTAKVTFVSIGSSILKIGLHPRAARFRAALEHVAMTPGLFWGEYQARTDVMNFYKTDPMREMGLKSNGGPVVRLVKLREMLEPATYRRIQHNFYRVHCQFVSGNDRRNAYDYFMLLCGPLSIERQINLPNGAASSIDANGALFAAPSYEDRAPEPAFAVQQ
ncbi:hypothetical protein [Bradyrhizobium sp. LHD-71]|uniref:hypothetical protein n=1 Tax=Bradyrhizobium sp. LHD-71 TaxID=3072141 RepID=UPI00280E0234|nr:hypothetical protein [Bradyrhizobium sp. LHD-71]MDQ8729919.1 hypothetical protein [Bradyrhizobium sp. LHD-71]